MENANTKATLPYCVRQVIESANLVKGSQGEFDVTLFIATSLSMTWYISVHLCEYEPAAGSCRIV